MHKCEGFLKEKEEKKKQQEENTIHYEYSCDCGRKFATAGSLRSHARFCNKYIKIPKTSKYKIDNYYVCECGKKYESFQSFNAHLSHCDIHHDKLGKEKKQRPSEINKSMNWEDKAEEEIQEIRNKSGKTYSANQKTGITKNPWKEKHHTNVSKQHHREAAIKYRKTILPRSSAAYNKNGCKYIDKLNEQFNWNLQHAENGGEIEIGGYFLDGYDKQLNIAFEYDEKEHYEDVYNNILKPHDIERQNYIINLTGCKFYRYNEKINLFYCVN